MLRGGCIGLQETTDTHCTSILNIGHHELNAYIGKNFFDDENYQAILDCLNGGYAAAKSLLTSMQEYVALRQEEANRLISYSTRCVTRLKHQSSLSTYHTTMMAQLQTYQISEQQAKIIKDSCDRIHQVIDNYNRQVNQMFPRSPFSTTHKHHQTHKMKILFKRARAPLHKVSDELKELYKEEKKARQAMHNGTVECQNPNLNSTINEKQMKMQDKLEEIQEDIVIKEEKQRKKKAIYIAKAADIFQKCQQLEKERLDQMNQTSIDFIQAIHPSQYSTELSQIYDNLLVGIKTEQNTTEDLNYWMNTYGAHTLVSSESSDTDQSDNDNEEDE